MKKHKYIKLIPIKEDKKDIPYLPDIEEFQFPRYNSYIPKCCEHCPNHPSNGGSGICLCTLPYFEDTGLPSFNYNIDTTINHCEGVGYNGTQTKSSN